MSALRNGTEEIGRITSHSVRSLLELGATLRYAAEILRQAGILLTGSALILVGMELVIGGECGLFTSYVGKSFGASGAVGLFSLVCDEREMFPYMFGYILAAKVGCGLVAEIGSMRIAEEIDAMEVMGIPSMRYIVGTRLFAAIIVLPLAYLMAMAAGTFGSYFVVVVQVGTDSGAGWASGAFGPAHTLGLDFESLVKAMAIGITIILVGTYYGYTASGGPVGVGKATAKSMMVNLVMIHFIGGSLSLLFWGTNSKLPIGG
jgi:phospholipid/cholesterol/gamma-HCH transport system permease protein